MKKAFSIITLTITILVGCNTQPSNYNSQNVNKDTISDEQSVVSTHIAILEIEGMMCEKGCGSVIRKGLYETGGVSEVKFDFNESNPVNEIKVLFDINKISAEDMIDVIGNLSNEQYSARLIKTKESTSIKSIKQDNDQTSHKKNTDLQNSKGVSSSKITFPDLAKLLNKLIKIF